MMSCHISVSHSHEVKVLLQARQGVSATAANPSHSMPAHGRPHNVPQQQLNPYTMHQKYPPTDYHVQSAAVRHSGQNQALSITSTSHANSSLMTTGFTFSGVKNADGRAVENAMVESNLPFPAYLFPPSGFSPQLPHSLGAPRQNQTKSVTDTFDLTHTAAPLLPPPGPNSSNDERVDFIQQQLDGFGAQIPIFDDVVLLGCGSSERRQGGDVSYMLCSYPHLCFCYDF